MAPTALAILMKAAATAIMATTMPVMTAMPGSAGTTIIIIRGPASTSMTATAAATSGATSTANIGRAAAEAGRIATGATGTGSIGTAIGGRASRLGKAEPVKPD